MLIRQQSLQSMDLFRAPCSSSWSSNGHQSMLGKAGLIEPSGRQVASLSADDVIRTFQQKHRCVLGGAHHLAWALTIVQS